ncbi:unnamed protein product, partial [Owenia fusiformis]
LKLKSEMENLSDPVLLNILQFLPLQSRMTLSCTNKRMLRLCFDKMLTRCTTFSDNFCLTDTCFRTYIKQCNNGKHISVLNLNNVYWIARNKLLPQIKKCTMLRELHVKGTKITPKDFEALLPCFQELQTLAFSFEKISDLKKDNFSDCQESLSHIKQLCIEVSHPFRAVTGTITSTFIGYVSTFIDWCTALEELHVTAGICHRMNEELFHFTIDENAMSNLRVYTHATGRENITMNLIFCGIMKHLGKFSFIWKIFHMRSLLLELELNPEFDKDSKQILTNMAQLKSLDLLDSSSAHSLPSNDTTPLSDAINLRFLRLQKWGIEAKELAILLSNLSKLRSLCLEQCCFVMLESGDERGKRRANMHGIEAISKHCPNLEYLNLSGICNPKDEQILPMSRILSTHVHITFPDVISKMKNLRGLAISLCHLDDNRPAECAVVDDAKDEDHKCDTPDKDGNCPMQVIAEGCPNMEEFELVTTYFESALAENQISPSSQKFRYCSGTRNVLEHDLSHIAKWYYLKKLTLGAIPNIDKGDFLVEIAEQCPYIQVLSLAFIGMTGHCKYDASLNKALPLMNNLNDFRLEQPNFPLSSAFFKALGKCRELRRFCCIAKNSKFVPKDITAFVQESKHLAVLQLLTGATIAACNALEKAVKNIVSQTRPGFCVTLYPLMADQENLRQKLYQVPPRHFRELTVFSSKVAQSPQNAWWDT